MLKRLLKIKERNLADVLAMVALSFFVAKIVLAQGYIPLEKLPIITNGNTVDVQDYIQGIVKLAIALAGGMAVIRIMIGGIQYMTAGAWSGKSDAKSTITNAILGLLLAITAAGILYVINLSTLNIPDLNSKITPIEGVNKAFDKNLGGSGDGSGNGGAVPTLTAEELNCTLNCVALSPSKTLLPLMPGACNNDPCYLNYDLIQALYKFKLNFGSNGWQIITAYPPVNIESANCSTLNASNVPGRCARIGITGSPDGATIKRLLEALKKSGFAYYNYQAPKPACTNLMNDPGIKAAGTVLCSPSGDTQEFATVEI